MTISGISMPAILVLLKVDLKYIIPMHPQMAKQVEFYEK
jgi:hypothetical protein